MNPFNPIAALALAYLRLFTPTKYLSIRASVRQGRESRHKWFKISK